MWFIMVLGFNGILWLNMGVSSCDIYIYIYIYKHNILRSYTKHYWKRSCNMDVVYAPNHGLLIESQQCFCIHIAFL